MRSGLGSSPYPKGFVPFHWHPRHMDGVVAAFGDAMLFASTGIRSRQNCNTLSDFQALDPAHLDAPAATSAFVCGYYGYPFGLHVRLSLDSFYFFPFLLHRDVALHPRVRRAVKMDHALLINS